MRVISKQISLENLTSRLPGVIPGYKDGKLYYFDDASLKKRDYAFTSNYGFVPANLGFNTCDYSSITINNISCDCKCVLSWETISEWFHFFTDYYHLLNDWGHCGVRYKTATEYYKNESKNGYAGQMVYGSEEQTYIGIDNLFNERGGKKFYEFLCKYVVPSMDIPSEYTDYWHATRLFYPDIIKWNGWFKNRYDLYGDITLSACSGKPDCCDCTEYVNRGGADMKNKLSSAYSNIKGYVKAINEKLSGDSSSLKCDNCFEPSMILPTTLQVSIDDMGEYSIFSEEYNLGTDYRTAKYGDTYNTNGGTVAVVDKRSMKLKEGVPGFGFNQYFMEKIYDPLQWELYSGNTSDSGQVEDWEALVKKSYNFYAFGDSMEKVTGDTEIAVRSKLKKSYDVTPLNAIYINGILYDISTEEYGYYKGDSGKTFYVFREEYTETPYTVINGKRIYGDVKPQSKDKYFYFPFFLSGTSVEDGTSLADSCGNPRFIPGKYKWYPRTKGTDTKSFIMYNGSPYEVNNTGVTINGDEYIRVCGKFANDDGDHYVRDVGNTKIVYSFNNYNELVFDANYSFVGGKPTTTTNKDVVVYEAGVVKGEAASKLMDLRCNTMLTDDTGSPIMGRYDVSGKTNHQPPQGQVLDLIYEKGNIGRMYPIDSLNSGSTEYYFGDMIIGMKFYYLDYSGDRIGDKEWSGSSLNTIKSIVIPSSAASSVDSGTVWCDIDYIIGGTFSGETKTKTVSGDALDIGTVYKLVGGNYSSGVCYSETVRFVRKQVQYKLSLGVDGQIPTTENAASAHTLCYPVICYVLEQDDKEIDSDYGMGYSYPVAKFKMVLPANSGWTGYGTGTELYPVFRQEYLLGSATMQNLDIDIYIDRGTNAAFEKHLKLGEVTSMEALEQYTNGYFKMEQ